MLTILAFLLLISIVVSVHEYGHYLAARYSGVKVLVFSVGFGKPLWACRFRGTLWQIGIIPLGGYVKMLSLSDPQYQGQYPEVLSLEAQPAYKKMLIDIAGPFANFVLASMIFMLIFVQGIEVLPPIIAQVTPDSYADKIGLQSEMKIVSINGQEIDTWEEAQSVFSGILAERGKATVLLQKPNGVKYKREMDFSTLPVKKANNGFFSALGLTPFPLTTQIEAIQDKSAAQKAGLRVGDKIVAIDDEFFSHWQMLWRKIRSSPNKMLQLTVVRDNKKIVIAIMPQSVEENGYRYGVIGVTPKVDKERLKSWVTIKHYSILQSLDASVKRTWQIGKNMMKMVGGMLAGSVSFKQLGGPIHMAQMAGSSLQAGWQIFIQSLALVSISLGVLNLLPIPILDGGRLLYHGAEWIRGRPLSDKAVIFGQRLSMVVIFLIMTLALFNDLSRLSYYP
jgi:regulator of sigma E protease